MKTLIFTFLSISILGYGQSFNVTPSELNPEIISNMSDPLTYQNAREITIENESDLDKFDPFASPYLETLNIINCNITTLNLENNFNLESLNLENSNVTNLIVKNTKTQIFNITDSNISKIYADEEEVEELSTTFSTATVSADWNIVFPETIHIPDGLLRYCILKITEESEFAKNASNVSIKPDNNNDWLLQQTESELVVNLTIANNTISYYQICHDINDPSCGEGINYFNLNQNTSIYNFTGLNQFTNLASLTIFGKIGSSFSALFDGFSGRTNQTNNLNIENFNQLTTLKFDNSFTSVQIQEGDESILEIKNNPNLESIEIIGINSWSNSTASPTFLNIENNPNLTSFYAEHLGDSTFNDLQNLTKIEIYDSHELQEVNLLNGLDDLNELIITYSNPDPNYYYYNGCGAYTEPNQLRCLKMNAINLSEPIPSLERINAQYTVIDENIDFSKTPNLNHLSASLVGEVDLSSLENLTAVDLSRYSGPINGGNTFGTLTSLNVENLDNLVSLSANWQNLSIVNLNDTPNLENISINNNTPQLREVFLKNGNDTENVSISTAGINAVQNNYYVCIDGGENTNSIIERPFYQSVTINPYCSFIPGGEFQTIEGTVRIATNNTSCTNTDPTLENIRLNRVYNTVENSIFTNENGQYHFESGLAGDHQISVALLNPSFFTATPSNFTATLPNENNPIVQDICLTPNGTNNDLEITMIPIGEARPGFNASYKIIYRNNGNTVLSGNVELEFDDDVLDYVSSNITPDSQIVGEASWNYTNLLPFESRSIWVTFNLNSPQEDPALNADDILEYNLRINPLVGDANSLDNEFTLAQTVVNSFDPNDKICLEGNTITPETVGQYVHYRIRFENEGTANAINIVVKDVINTNMFDVSTLMPIDASHSYETRITNGNEVEFIFKNINLPFDDANNDGYIVFKIKTLNTLLEGDILENKADIFFDFNFPITTNNFETTIEQEAVLGTVENENNNRVQLYPNPTSNELNIESKESIESINIYNSVGKIVKTARLNSANSTIKLDVSHLNAGVYFVEISTNSGKTTQKFVKK